MSSQPEIPRENLELSRKIGKWLESGRPLVHMEEPQIKELLEYRKEVEGYQTDHPAKETVWERIEADITTPVNKPGIPPFTPTTAAWAAAATILIVTLSFFFYFQQSDRPQLLAESSSAIEQVTLNDGSEVTLRPNSSLFLVDDGPGSQLYELYGEAYFDVEYDPGRTFSVEAGEGVVEVLGTRFNLSDWGGQTELFLEEGSVRLELADKSDNIVLEPGQQSGITREREIIQPEVVSIEEVTSWRNNELVFSNRRAGQLFEELEYHFNIEITAPQQVLDEELGGSISLESKENSLSDLSMVLGGTFASEDNEHYQFVMQE